MLKLKRFEYHQDQNHCDDYEFHDMNESNCPIIDVNAQARRHLSFFQRLEERCVIPFTSGNKEERREEATQ